MLVDLTARLTSELEDLHGVFRNGKHFWHSEGKVAASWDVAHRVNLKAVDCIGLQHTVILNY